MEVHGGSFLDEQTGIPSGADAYIMKHIIHDWDDEKVSTNPFPATFSSSRLMILNALYLYIYNIYNIYIYISIPCGCALQSEVILKATRKAMPEHAKVLLVEYVVPTGPQACLAKGLDLRKLPHTHIDINILNIVLKNKQTNIRLSVYVLISVFSLLCFFSICKKKKKKNRHDDAAGCQGEVQG